MRIKLEELDGDYKMTDDKKPPFYYVVLHTLKAYEQANYASGKRKREADKRKELQEQSNEKDSGLSDVD